MMIEKITPAGKIFAEESGDSHYPGIHLCMYDKTEDGREYEREIALLEWDECNKRLRLAVWGNKEQDDYTDNFDIVT